MNQFVLLWPQIPRQCDGDDAVFRIGEEGGIGETVPRDLSAPTADGVQLARNSDANAQTPAITIRAAPRVGVRKTSTCIPFERALLRVCYRRTDTLWEGRYQSTLIQSEAHLLSCMRYIELNPVRAGLVTRPTAYRWSSHAGNALGQADEIIAPHTEYLGLGGSAPARQAAYRLLFKDRIPERELAAIRTATNKSWVLGNDRFKRRMEKLAARRVEPAPRGGDRKSVEFKAARKIKRV